MGRSKYIFGTPFERWSDKVLVGDGCWEWQAGHHSYGYGTLGGKNWRAYAHRLSYQMFRGPVPSWLCVCHSCDNPNCVKPSHLFLGTKADNTHDMLAKGRQVVRFGENHPHAKLTCEEARQVRDLASAKVLSARQIGRDYGITHGIVCKIRDRELWGHA
jgi:hypothetical protein